MIPRKINDRQPTVSQPQAKLSRAPVIGKSSMPQIIQVTSVERSRTKDYCGQVEGPGIRMNNKPTAGATEMSRNS